MVNNIDSYQEEYWESERYKVVAKEEIKGVRIEVRWGWDWRDWSSEQRKYGAWYLAVGDFWLKTFVNNIEIN
jgi:hypothetical protein